MTQRAVIDIGATWIRGGLVSVDGTVTQRLRIPTPKIGISGVVVTNAVIGILEKLLPTTPPGSGVGISSAGPLDLTSGSIASSPNMVFDRIDLISPLRERFSRPVSLINDCRAGALAEQAFGAGKGQTDLVYITFSSGIGGGVISGGRLITGSTGNGGEIGHLYVDGRYHLVCGCGGTGHFEAYASGNGIPRFYRRFCAEEGIFIETLPDADTILSSEEAVPARFRDELAVICGRGLSGVIAAYDPKIIILDGPVVRNHPDFVSAMIEQVDRYLPMPKVVVSPLGGDAPLIGAGVAAFNGRGLKEDL
ncbi:ROK family protein [Methanocalculus sp.]|uniref:ROK family protein n=1 Tax=Methanocalculus sp. TaxID=2004547 RepID=UPI0027224695|nr:ROK family protein [Methanocalculus sp.]MDO8841654.1 ROK family protein [Methanocalculus sp.]